MALAMCAEALKGFARMMMRIASGGLYYVQHVQGGFGTRTPQN